jgi:hypothetical protein
MGVSIDQGDYSATFLKNSPSTDTDLGTLTCRAQSIPPGSYAYQVFLPDGSMALGTATTPPVLRVTSDRNAKNYYQIAFNQFTGGVKIQRP